MNTSPPPSSKRKHTHPEPDHLYKKRIADMMRFHPEYSSNTFAHAECNLAAGEKLDMFGESFGVPRLHYADTITIRSTITFSWWDRLRILFGRKVHQETRVHTQLVSGHTYAEDCHTHVDAIMARKPIVMSRER